MFHGEHKLYRKNTNAVLAPSAYGSCAFWDSWQLLAPKGTDHRRNLFSARAAGDESRCGIGFRTFRTIWSRRDHRNILWVWDAWFLCESLSDCCPTRGIKLRNAWNQLKSTDLQDFSTIRTYSQVFGVCLLRHMLSFHMPNNVMLGMRSVFAFIAIVVLDLLVDSLNVKSNLVFVVEILLAFGTRESKNYLHERCVWSSKWLPETFTFYFQSSFASEHLRRLFQHSEKDPSCFAFWAL